MPRIWQKIDRWFIPAQLHDNGLLLGKARIMTAMHLVLLFVGVVSVILNFTILPQKDFPAGLALFVVTWMPWAFRRWGSFNLSGNTLSLSIACVIAPNIPENGLLHADDTVWLMLCPVLAALFCNGGSALAWFLSYAGFLGWIFWLEIQLPKPYALPYTPEHYLGSYVFLAGVFTLVTYLYHRSERRIFDKMQENHDHLEQQRRELTTKTAELRRLSEQLARSNRELEAFAYSAGHDLKEPVRMISAYSQLLQRRSAGQLSPENLEFMAFIHEGATRMQRLIDDLLEYSRVGQNKDKISEIDLDDVLFYITTNLKLAIDESHARVEIEGRLPKVTGRYSEMVQLFQNLVGNALKFRRPGVAPEVRVSCTEIGEFFTLKVADNGIGMEAESLKKIFDPFVRMHSRTEFEGTGLGLAICQKIVHSLGGEIWAESAVGEGTTFFVQLPKELPADFLVLAEPAELLA